MTQQVSRTEILRIYQDTSHQDLAAIAWGRELISYRGAKAISKEALIALLDSDNAAHLAYLESTNP